MKIIKCSCCGAIDNYTSYSIDAIICKKCLSILQITESMLEDRDKQNKKILVIATPCTPIAQSKIK